MANMRIPEGVSIDEPSEPGLTRREAVRNGALYVASAGLGAQIMAATGADTAVARSVRSVAGATRNKPGYGPLVKVKGADFSLPKDFTVVKFGEAGSKMSDGLRVPKHHDGTTAARSGRHAVRILRNHENAAPGKSISKRNAYDRTARGGVTSTVFDTKNGKAVASGLVLNGTDNNCNGGPTPWGSWLTCEESTVGPNVGFEKPHGYVFEVPFDARGPIEPRPIKAMGRFLHEACAVDPRTGIVYMTEDNGPDGFYRFIPNRPGKLHRGGKLQMLKVRGHWKYDTVTGQKVGEKLHAEWVTIDDPDPKYADQFPDSVYKQGREKGAARFMGLEGAGWGRGHVYFTASEAGDTMRGQIWRYTPSRSLEHGTLELLFESNDRKVLDQPDSVCVSPRGGLVLCEDGDGEELNRGTNYLRCLTPKGSIETFARNQTPLDLHRWEGEKKGTIGRSEWSGACYSPDGKWMFVHIQIPGVSYAITGPWERGWL
jgi:secreted PhoX family phosphatase